MKTWGRGGLEMAFWGKEAKLILELRRGAVVEIRGSGGAGRRWSPVEAGSVGERAGKRGDLGAHPRTKSNL
jgi:hypothetical protein